LRATIKDVAAEAGVSTTAVSLVLNGKNNKISEKTRKQILEAVDKLNYRPNHIAMSMVTKSTQTIGLVIPDISNIYFSELSKLIEQSCYSYGYNVLYGNTHDMALRDIDYINIFLDRNVDAIILILSNSTDEHLRDIQKIITSTDTPFIVVDRMLDIDSGKTIVVNQKLGGYLATQHLINLGHRSIGCITGPKNVYSSIERLNGYKEALLEANLPIDENLIFEGDFHRESGMEALPYLLGRGVTAIFAFNDMMALGVYKQASYYNLSIPDNLSLVGYDDIFISDFISPPLTSIEQPVKKLADEAVNQVMNAIQNNDKQKSFFVFDPMLKVRGSTKMLSSK
jgi:LacI family transcriptional regulator